MKTFGIKEVDDYRLILYDTTRRSITAHEDKIYSINITIFNSNLPEKVVIDNVLNYMLSNQTDNEIYTIDSNTLGLGKGFKLPDGIYRIVIKVNNTYEVHNHILIVNEIQSKILKLQSNINESEESIKKFNRNTESENNLIEYYYIMYKYTGLIRGTGSLADVSKTEIKIKELQSLLNKTVKINI